MLLPMWENGSRKKLRRQCNFGNVLTFLNKKIKSHPTIFMKHSFILFLSLAAFRLTAQECDCPKTFDWMVNTFEANDAGFQYVIDKKGKDDYTKHTTLAREKAKAAVTMNDCGQVLYSWMRYFRPGHIAVQQLQNGNAGNESKIADADIRQQYKNTPKLNLTEKQLIALLNKKTAKDPLEGIWSNGTYRIGIVANDKSTTEFSGFILKADSIYWMPGQVKVELKQAADHKGYTIDYYMRDHSKQPGTAEFVSSEKNLLLLFGDYWTREYPKNIASQKEQLLVKFSKARLPFAERLSDKTLYLRIPSFAAEQKQVIDSVIAKYDAEISKTPNLIIDIRNGTGGSDASYSSISPYMYTQPIRTVGVQLYATELNAKAFEEYAKQYDDSSDVRYCRDVAARMRANPGKFITMLSDDKAFSMDTLPAVLPYPQKIAIVCNHNNGSTDEQFLLEAKQSKKVKIYGTSTGGMLDISNMNFVNSPDGKFSIGYCMSKSFRIPDFCIDGVGIQPDCFIDAAIAPSDWIDYVKLMIEQ